MSDLEDELMFQMRITKLPTPVREYMFHPTRKWRFDMAWPDRMVAFEVEGGTFVQGRHTRGVSFEKDCEKYAEAQFLGWRVFRVTGGMVNDGRALALAERALSG